MKQILKLAVLITDLIVIGLCVLLAYYLRYSMPIIARGASVPGFAVYRWAVLLALCLWIFIFLSFHLDDFPPAWEVAEISRRVTAGVAALMLLLLAGSYLQKLYYSRLLLAFLAVLLVIGLIVIRLGTRGVLRYMHRHGVATRRLVIAGHPREAMEAASRIQQDPTLNYEIVGILAPSGSGENATSGNGVNGSTWAGSSFEVSELLEMNHVDEILFTLPVGRNSELLDLLARCQQHGLTVRLLADFYQLYPYINLTELATLPVLEVRQLPHQYFLKRPFDIIVSCILVALLSPLLLGFAALLWWANGGKIIVRQTLVGQYLRHFKMYRFNKPGNGPFSADWLRRLGSFLDKYSLLDLPQLFNVLRGEMRLVGPRPETLERVRFYSEWNKKRLAVKPGITGSAQVRGLRGSSFSDEKTHHDLRYLVKASFLGDLFLLLRTAVVIARRSWQPSNAPLPFARLTVPESTPSLPRTGGENADR